LGHLAFKANLLFAERTSAVQMNDGEAEASPSFTKNIPFPYKAKQREPSPLRPQAAYPAPLRRLSLAAN